MNQVSETLRKVEGGYAHWCPGCEEMHVLPDRWKFNGSFENPTFTPSFRHQGVRAVYVNGEWTGEFVRDTNGNTIPFVCHYHLIGGKLHFCPDSTHALAGKTAALPDLPAGFKDGRS